MSEANQTALDLILRTRLDLLDQAVDEADSLLDAMAEQRDALREVGNSLRPDGRLSRSEKNARVLIEDALNRLSMVLTGNTGATPETVAAAVEQDRLDASEFDNNDEQDADPTGSFEVGNPRDFDEEDRKRTEEAFNKLWKVRPELDRLSVDRTRTHTTFEDVRRWSVAEMTDKELRSAADEYRAVLEEIRQDPNPWTRYELEMHGHGKALYTRYLELLGGMAFRGLENASTGRTEVQMLMSILLRPMGRRALAAVPPPMPFVPMGTLHAPLGYSDWGLWALPLVGRRIGELLLTEKIFSTSIDSSLVLICADIYALYVLGPAYAHAAVFLELDPGSLNEDSPDPYRAEALFFILPQLDPAEQDLENITESIRKPWQDARNAFHAPKAELSDDDVAVIEEFFGELKNKFGQLAFDLKFLSTLRDTGDKLAKGGSHLDGLAMPIGNLITALWLARMSEPDKAKVLHSNAKLVANRRPSGPRALDPTRSSSQRLGF